MAFPDDEENGTSGFRATGLAVPASAAPVRPPIGAAPAAFDEHQITSLLPQIAAAAPVSGDIGHGGDPFWLGLRERSGDSNFSNVGGTIRAPGMTKKEYDLLHPEVADQISSHEHALSEADKYLNLQTKLHGIREQTQAKLDSADFVGALSKLDHSDPDYEKNATALLARYPRAGGVAVQQALDLKQRARAQYQHGNAKGGADQFTENSPEREAYLRRYAQTHGNVEEAQAHAENVAKGEELIRAGVASGTFNPADLTWEGDKPVNPGLFTRFGTPDYHAIGLKIAQNAGAQAQARVAEQTAAAARAAAGDTRAAESVVRQVNEHDQHVLFEGAKAVIAQYAKKKPDTKDLAGWDRYKRAQEILTQSIQPAVPGAAGTPVAPAATNKKYLE